MNLNIIKTQIKLDYSNTIIYITYLMNIN